MLNENGKRLLLKLHSKDIFLESGILPNQNTGQENHLIYVATGSCIVQNATKSARVTSRGLVYIRRNVQYTLLMEEGSPVLVYRLHFIRSSGQCCLDLDKLCELSPFIRDFFEFRSRICFLTDCEDMYITVNELVSEMDGNLEGKDQMVASLMALLYIKMSRSFHTHGITSGITYINEAKKYIAEHYDEDLCVPRIADHLGISRSYLEILFSKYANRKITTHINTVRTDKAAYFLATTNMEILDIALAVGYGTRQHFTRVFGKRYGTSPSQYRRLHGKKN